VSFENFHEMALRRNRFEKLANPLPGDISSDSDEEPSDPVGPFTRKLSTNHSIKSLVCQLIYLVLYFLYAYAVGVYLVFSWSSVRSPDPGTDSYVILENSTYQFDSRQIEL